jgi:hypothetical protein
MRIILILLLSTLIGGGATYAWHYYGGFAGEKGTSVAFVEAYGTYVEVSGRVEALVHAPGTAGNSSRQELLALLNSILTDTLSPSERASLARIAFTHLDAIKKEIDAAQASQAKLYAVLQDFDNASRVFRGIELRTQATEIVALARKRAELTSRITAILSETNDHTYAIITRILGEEGALSPEHMTAINDATALAEERYATLEALYAELIAHKTALDRAFAEFTRTAI